MRQRLLDALLLSRSKIPVSASMTTSSSRRAMSSLFSSSQSSTAATCTRNNSSHQILSLLRRQPQPVNVILPAAQQPPIRHFFSKMSKEQRVEPKAAASDDTPNSQQQSTVSGSGISTNQTTDRVNTARSTAKEAAEADATGNAAETTEISSQPPANAEMNALKKQFDTEKQELNKKLADVVDRYKRALAETENVRTRLTKQAQDARIFGIQSFCKDLLDVSDVMAKAMQNLPETGSDPTVKLIVDGMRATDAQLQQVFQRHGLVRINPLNEKFNPNLHEAVFQVPAQEGQESGQVVVVEKVGYKLHERCLRPALVGVAKA